MGCGLNSGVGSDLRGSGDRSRRVSGKLGLGFESSSTTKTNLAHDLLGEFSGCYSHIVNVMLYCLICLSFFKYWFDGFRPLSMCSRPYIFVFEITGIPAPFSFPKISYRFCFR